MKLSKDSIDALVETINNKQVPIYRGNKATYVPQNHFKSIYSFLENQVCTSKTKELVSVITEEKGYFINEKRIENSYRIPAKIKESRLQTTRNTVSDNEFISAKKYIHPNNKKLKKLGIHIPFDQQIYNATIPYKEGILYITPHALERYRQRINPALVYREDQALELVIYLNKSQHSRNYWTRDTVQERLEAPNGAIFPIEKISENEWILRTTLKKIRESSNNRFQGVSIKNRNRQKKPRIKKMKKWNTK